MKRLSVLVFAFAVSGPCFISGQPAGDAQGGATGTSSQDSCTPASTNVIAAQYPCIYSDRRVMLQIKAPEAQHVQALIGGGGAQTPMMDMAKQADGIWTLATPPGLPDLLYQQIVRVARK